jgi:hypothetical protein
MRGIQLLIAAFAVFQCLRYGRSALRFLSPAARREGEGRRAHLVGFLVTVVALVLLASSIHILLRGTPQG